MVAITDIRPSISGTAAASSEPNTSTRMSSVNGSDRVPAWPSWSPTILLIALSELTSPASPMYRPGWRCATPETAFVSGSMWFSALSSGPVMSHSTSAV